MPEERFKVYYYLMFVTNACLRGPCSSQTWYLRFWLVIGKFWFRYRLRPKFHFEPIPKFRFRFFFMFRYGPKHWLNDLSKFRFNFVQKITYVQQKVTNWFKFKLISSIVVLHNFKQPHVLLCILNGLCREHRTGEVSANQLCSTRFLLVLWKNIFCFERNDLF